LDGKSDIPELVTAYYHPCKKCGRQVSTSAESCPSCGAPVKKRTSWGAIVAILIGIIILAGLWACDQGGKNPVKAQVSTTATGLVVTNLDEFTWPSVTVYINGDPITGYSFAYKRPVNPRETIPLRFFEFTSGDKRFNPIERKVKQVIVYVPDHAAPIFGFD
jgi:zinc-ribbon domain